MRTILLGVSFTAAMALALGASGDNYPSRTIRFVVPYPAGGGADTAARILAQKVAGSVGQQVIIDNRPGASEVIATELVARAPADGYTLLVATNSFAINAVLAEKLPYDSVRDFALVARMVTTPLLLVVNPNVAAHSLQELLALAKATPGKLNYASIGLRTPHHLTMEWVKKTAGVDIVAVPYTGVVPAFTAVISGDVHMMLTGMTAGLAQVRSGKLRALAVTSAVRAPAAPEVPTFAEAGLRGFEVVGWYGIVAPSRTPPEAISRLSNELQKALAAADVQERLANIGVEPAYAARAEFDERIRYETALWRKVATELKTTDNASK